MKRYSYKKVDAFTSKSSMGNPAAFLEIGSDKLTHEECMNIAKEHDGFVSEVVFCSDSNVADCKLTYYSSQCEVDFCGHGSIATMYELIRCNNNLRNKKEIFIETNRKGVLTVYNNLDDEDSVYIAAPKPVFLENTLKMNDIATHLGIDTEDISDRYNIDFIDAGLRTLIVPIKEIDKEISIYPNEMSLKQFCLDNNIDIILIFSADSKLNESFAHTRIFAPKFGYLEDPATGSGNSAFGYYLLKNKLWNGSKISIEQGGDNINFNIVNIKSNGQDILFGGSASLRIEGWYYNH